MPVVVLLVAGFLSWWSAKTASGVEQHVRNEVFELIPLVQNNPTVVNKMVIDPVLRDLVEQSFSTLSTVWSGNKGDLHVTVTTGDDPQYGDGSATHVAVVAVKKQPVVGIRIVCDGKDEPMYIAGVWSP
ncbi:MAG: hypothetical protein QGI78_00675 [Phycisphaerales bacterium]|jgi:hypothetical protein|nr:hypothetical protein [Phycisphaerales bacterium]